MKLLMISAGALLGLFAGMIFEVVIGVRRTKARLPPLKPGQGIGWDVVGLVRDPSFWPVPLVCALGFAFLFSLIGHRK